jgi:hypothetical protein
MYKFTPQLGALMKTIVCLLLMVTTQVFAETYSCSAELSRYRRQGEVEIKTYKRDGNEFIAKSALSDTRMKILYESKTDLVLTDVSQFRDGAALFVTMISKTNMEYYETFFSVSDGREPGKYKPLWGKCILH